MSIQIKQLHIGQVIKNYRELCSILELPIKGGNAKKAQYKDIEQYCKLDRDGNKFIVLDIYDNVIPKIDNRGKSINSHGNNNTIDYIDTIEEVLLNYIATEGGHIRVTMSQLMLQLGFCNENLKEVAIAPVNVAYEHEYKTSDLLECADNINLMLRNRLTSSLDNLVKANQIIYKKVIVLYDKKEKELVDATPEQITLLDGFKKQTLDKFHCNDLSEIFMKRKNILFFKNYYRLIEENIGFDMAFTMLDINISNMSQLFMYYRNTATKDTDYINKSIMENILRNAARRHDKANNTDIYAPENQYKKEKIEYKKSAEYVKNYEKFCNDFINISDDILGT